MRRLARGKEQLNRGGGRDEASLAQATLTDFENALLGKRRTTLIEDQDRQVLRAIAWLRNWCSPDGYWGAENVAVTALAALAIGRWRPDKAAELLGETNAWLEQSQEGDGSWQNVWDTAVTLQALTAAGHGRSATAQRARGFLLALDPSRDPAWPDSLHFPAQVLCALDQAGVERETLFPWSEFLLRHIDRRHGTYVRGQVIYALTSTHTAESGEIEEDVLSLKEDLRRGAISEPEFLQWTPALQALSMTGRCGGLIEEKAGVLLSECREDGSWYAEPRHTAWALLALHAVRSKIEIAVDRDSFDGLVRLARQGLEDARRLARARRRQAAIYGALGGMSLLGLVVLVVAWNEAQSILISGIALTALLGLLTVSVRALFRLVR